MSSILKIGMAQISPVWLNKEKTIEKVNSYIVKAAKEECDLVVFGEGLLPGYPFWLSITNGSEFNSPVQKEIHAHYLKNSIEVEKGDLNSVCKTAKENSIAIYLGIIERAVNRGGHSLYCSLVYIDKTGTIQSHPVACKFKRLGTIKRIKLVLNINSSILYQEFFKFLRFVLILPNN